MRHACLSGREPASLVILSSRHPEQQLLCAIHLWLSARLTRALSSVWLNPIRFRATGQAEPQIVVSFNRLQHLFQCHFRFHVHSSFCSPEFNAKLKVTVPIRAVTSFRIKDTSNNFQASSATKECGERGSRTDFRKDV